MSKTGWYADTRTAVAGNNSKAYGRTTPGSEMYGPLSPNTPLSPPLLSPEPSTAGIGNPSAASSSHTSNDYTLAQANMTAAAQWDNGPEPDDSLHNPDMKDRWRGIDLAGMANVLTVTFLLGGLLMLFGGYPLLDHYTRKHHALLQLNGTGQMGSLPIQTLIDPDTPSNAQTWTSGMDSTKYNLVFSDEFNQEGRTFWPGDDPYWEAVDIYYGATNDYEWYAPEAANTTGGALQLTMTQNHQGKGFHNLNFQSGMIQSWNKLCFQGGYLEIAAKLPGTQETRGWWPGIWTMGNLGRPGYLGSTDGMWPYSYAACDWGTLPNQTNPEQTAPAKALKANGPYSYQYDYRLSFLPGQRTSACTCPGEDHPGPDVTVSRSAPEIDLIEAQNSNKVGKASMSLQVAPYDDDYWWHNQSAVFYGDTIANDYTGSVYQEAVSGLASIPEDAYIDAKDSRFVTYGLEIRPDWNQDGSGSITWYLDGKRTWHAPGSVVPPNPRVNISRRIIPTEPMSIIINYGISAGFQGVHFDELTFPNRMQIDYARLYQKAGETPKLSCDPPDHPTAKYIQDHADLYYNPNHSIFPKDKYSWPKNRLMHSC